MVVQIQSEGDASHLVTLARGSSSCSHLFVELLMRVIDCAVSDDESDGSSWHVFNDFLVCAISQDEALSFSSSWKVSLFPLLFVVGILRAFCRYRQSYSTNESTRKTSSIIQLFLSPPIHRSSVRILPSPGTSLHSFHL